ncbi:MAG: MFS transporter [Algibacter sp.]|uniref:MFS transporter n=1 Tax=Algibacter sp. TaxID=1872428 RepID=UPI00261B17B7|nr:MFS transporter [Algibacter sp.]MDG1730503.1 MFS transporter [Algibacter sp.]MDG2179725.1 MFS transporter [Algibacter sp.]
MSTINTASKNKVPFGQKVAFGVGMLANQMFPAILSIFMVVLVQDLGFPGWMWALVYFFPRIFDAITDPIMGYISDNTKSKWGRRRQYVLIGGLVMGIAYIFMWQLFRGNSLQFNFWYFFLWSVVFYLGLTIFSVPYVAMGYEMSDDFHERTNIMAIAQWIGQWAWVIAPLFWIIMYDPEWFPSAEIAVRQLAVWVAIPCAICAMVPAIFIKSESTLNEDFEPLSFMDVVRSLKKIFYTTVKEALKIKEFRKLCAATFLVYNAFNTVAALTFFVIVYKLFNGDAAASGIWVSLFGFLGALGTTFLVIPVVARMSKVMGKKKAFMVSQAISVIGYVMLWFLFVPGKPWLYIIALPFFSFGIGSLFTIMMSMTADVIDIDELRSGLRREGIFGAIYWWMVKVGFAIAGGLSGLIIAIVGFNPDLATTDQQSAVDGLHAFFCFFPMIGTLLAMYVMRNYDITEERAHEIRAEIDTRQEAIIPEVSSYYQIDKLLSYSNIELDSDNDIDFSSKSQAEIKSLFKDTLNNGLHGLCFSPYLEDQNIGDQLSENQIHQRMEIIRPYAKWVRSFSCTDGNEFIPIVAHKSGIRTMVGAWIGKDKAKNEVEIKALIDLAKNGHVDIAVVGNEVLLRNDLSENEIMAYIYRVKKALPDIPVGYVDAYYQYNDHPKLIEACDIILVNCYPFWEGCDINKSLAYLKQMYTFTKSLANGKQVIISETGWPNKGDSTNSAVPSKENAMKYFIKAKSWAQENNIGMFYFSSFDESWKVHHEGDVGQRWGIWDKNEKPKYS